MIIGAERKFWAVALLVALGFIFVPPLLEPRPYRVAGAAFSVDGPDVTLVAHIVKNDECTRVSIEDGGYVVRGIGPFGVDALEFTDLDGRPDEEDRVAGASTLRHRLIDASRYDRIEVWTRHLCDDRKVDRMLGAFDVPQ